MRTRRRPASPGALLAPVVVAATLVLAPGGGRSTAPGVPLPRFSDATEEAGVSFVHDHGGSGQRFMVETMGSGLALADFDGDGRPDLYFAQGAATPGATRLPPPSNELYRNLGGRFRRAPAHAGAASTLWSMGAAAADFDDDGFVDLYVTNFGRDQLYRNNGDGTFAEVAEEAGLLRRAWSSSAAWSDLDGDGDLDLYVAAYVDFDYDNHKFCGDPRRNLRAYCHPDVYNAVADLLYRNDGDGTFTEVGRAAGVADTLDGKGLGVAAADFDDDGDPDLYVANDSTRNFLYTNRGDGTFSEEGLLAGVGFSADGQAEAGMGTEWGDYDDDGRLDVVVTNLDLETNSLYRNVGGGFFDHVSSASGIGEPSLLFVGFGVNWLDADNDSDLDLFVANGHIIDNIEQFRDNIRYAQRNHLFVNDGRGRFTERGTEAGAGMALEKVSRGSVAGDLDDDGDVDLVVSNNGQRADLLRNDGPAANAIALRLVGRAGNRSAAGARVRFRPAGAARWHVREIQLGSSYASSSDPSVQLGLGDAAAAEVTVRWPAGRTQALGTLAAGHRFVVVEGRGVVARRAFARARPRG